MRLALLALAGCAHVAPVPPPPRPCLTTPPPAAALAPRVRDGCPAGLVCLTDDGARDTAHWLEALDAWAREAWAACQLSTSG